MNLVEQAQHFIGVHTEEVKKWEARLKELVHEAEVKIADEASRLRSLADKSDAVVDEAAAVVEKVDPALAPEAEVVQKVADKVDAEIDKEAAKASPKSTKK